MDHSAQIKNKFDINKNQIEHFTVSDSVTVNYNNFAIKNKNKKYPIEFQIPNLEESFRGREMELKEIEYKFLSNKQTIAITGMAGIGKTELAKQFMIKHKKKFKNLLWIKAKTQRNLIQSFKDLAKELEINEDNNVNNIIKNVYSYFKEVTSLFVFDNAENLRDITEFLPSKTKNERFILITSQYKDWGENITMIPLNPLHLNDSLEVIKIALGSEHYNNYDIKDWIDFAQYLESIPLALQITTALIYQDIRDTNLMQQPFNLRSYIEKLKMKKIEIVSKSFPVIKTNDYKKSIYVAIKLSLERIEKYNEPVAKDAVDLLHIMAHLDSDYILNDILLFCSNINFSQKLLNKALVILMRYSFINIKYENSKKYIQIHRLIQQSLCLQQKSTGTEEKYFSATLYLICNGGYYKYIHFKAAINSTEQNSELCNQYYTKTKSLKFLKYLVICEFDNILSVIFQNVEANVLKKHICDTNFIIKACKNADVKSVRTLIKYGGNVNKHIYGTYPIHEAVEQCNLELIQELVEAGAKLNVKNFKQFSPLFLLFNEAERINTYKIIQIADYLVNKGSKIKTTDSKKQTLLHVIVSKHNLKFVKWIYSKCYINPNCLDKYKNPPKFYIKNESEYVHINSSEIIIIIKFLVEKGFKPTKLDGHGQNLLFDLIKLRSYKIIKWICQNYKFDLKLQDFEGNTILHELFDSKLCTENPREAIKIADFLIANGADPKTRNEENMTILHFITKHHNISLLKWAVNKCGLNIHIRNNNGFSPLYYCLLHDNIFIDSQDILKVIKFLLQKGAEINLKNKENITFLHLIAAQNSYDLLHWLIDFNLPYIRKCINNVDIEKRSVIDYLLANSYLFNLYPRQLELKKVLNCLIDLGVDIENINEEGDSILHLFARNANITLMKWTLDSFEVNVNKINIYGETAVHALFSSYYLENEPLELEEFCRTVKFDANIVSKMYGTILHTIIMKRSFNGFLLYKVLKIIINYTNIDLNIQNSSGNASAHCLFYLYKFRKAEMNTPIQIKTVHLLLKKGANFNLQNKEKKTVYQLAKEIGFKTI